MYYLVSGNEVFQNCTFPSSSVLISPSRSRSKSANASWKSKCGYLMKVSWNSKESFCEKEMDDFAEIGLKRHHCRTKIEEEILTLRHSRSVEASRRSGLRGRAMSPPTTTRSAPPWWGRYQVGAMMLLMRSRSCLRRWWAAASRGRQAAGDWEVGRLCQRIRGGGGGGAGGARGGGGKVGREENWTWRKRTGASKGRW